MNRIPGAAYRPYPNVVERQRADGSKVYKAQVIHRKRSGKCVSKYLGQFDNPLRAYYEVINERATIAEKRAQVLRAEADQILSDLVKGVQR